MNHRRLTRRTVLRGVAGISIALPLLEAMRPRLSRAQSTAPQRFGVFFMPDGINTKTWEPTGEGTGFQLSTSLKALEPHRDDIVILRGVDFATSNKPSFNVNGGQINANPHDLGMAHMLTASHMVVRAQGRADHVTNGTAGGPSIDQAIAQVIGGQTKLRSLELGVESTTSKLEPMVLHMSYGGPDDARTPIDDPKQTFTRLFGDTDATQSEVELLLNQRRSVLDAVLNDFKNVTTSVGYDDRQRLERHAGHIRDIENRVANLPPTAGLCASPAEPTVSAELVDCVVNEHSSTPMNAKCLASFAEVGKAQMDLMVLAFACDLSRVVSLQWSTAEGTTLYSFLPGITGEHHRMSHDTATYGSQLTQADTWYAEQFAYLLSEMKKIPEGEGTLLDNTLMYWVNEQENGQAHNRNNVPMVLAGKAGGQLTGGRLLRYRNEPHNKLYTTFLNMFGVEATQFGDDFAGSLSGLV